MEGEEPKNTLTMIYKVMESKMSVLLVTALLAGGYGPSFFRSLEERK